VGESDSPDLQISSITRANSEDGGDLELKEVNPKSPQSFDSTLIDIRNASFGWSIEGSAQINDVSFSVLRHNFVFVIGPVGCGKSTLLKGLLGETPSLRGFVYSNAVQSAFVDQTPWIQNCTIKQNIIGRSLVNQPWYEEVIRACALDHDIAGFPESHGTHENLRIPSNFHWH